MTMASDFAESREKDITKNKYTEEKQNPKRDSLKHINRLQKRRGINSVTKMA